KIDKLRLDFSVKVHALMEMQVCSYYRSTMYGAYSSAQKLFRLRNDGTVDIGLEGVIENAATYKAGEWIDVSIYFNYADHYATYYMNDEFIGVTPLKETLSHFNQIRFRIETATTTTYSDYGVSVDNIRYSTPYSEKYIKRDYDYAEIARLDFKDVNVETVINSTTDLSKYYFVKSDDSVTVKYDAEKGHNVAFLDKIDTKYEGFGMSADTVLNSDIYKKNNKYPQIVRIEAELKRVGNQAVYMRVDGQEILRHSGTGGIQIYNGDVGKNPDVEATLRKPTEGTWYTVAVDLDFATGKYRPYYNGGCLGEYDMPEGITSPENIDISSLNKAENLYINYISIQTLVPYDEDSLCEYLDWYGDYNIGYAMNNNSDTDAAHKLLIAKFKADGTLDTVTISEKTVAAVAYSVCSTPLVEAADGGYYKYFVWENLDSIKPLISNEIVK
ncbi:MAG: hypothetical protein IJ365_05360, partial [Clostridia bacterium]|nr:hypothetical protein [Clostridia bacterium]